MDKQREDKVSEEKLLNINETAEYLELSLEEVKKLVDAGRIPAYQIGGVFLRFKKSQLEAVKNDVFSSRQPSLPSRPSSEKCSFSEKFKDFFYFNDFYIISLIIILIILAVIFI